MGKTLIRKGFKLDNGDIVRFIAPQAENDTQGRRIDTTYVEKDEFLRRMSENDDNARKANDSAKEATAQASIATKSASTIDSVIKEVAKSTSSDIDTILAGSTVAAEVSRIPSVELIESTGINAICNAVNSNNSKLKEVVLSLCEYIQKLTEAVAYFSDEPFPDIPAKVLQLNFEKLYGVKRITTGGTASASTAVVGKAVCGSAVCGII